MVNTPSVPKPGTRTPDGVYLRSLMDEAADVYGDSAITMLPSFVATPERTVDEPPLNVKATAPPVPNVESRVGLVPTTLGAPVVHVGIPPPMPPLLPPVMENETMYEQLAAPPATVIELVTPTALDVGVPVIAPVCWLRFKPVGKNEPFVNVKVGVVKNPKTIGAATVID